MGTLLSDLFALVCFRACLDVTCIKAPSCVLDVPLVALFAMVFFQVDTVRQLVMDIAWFHSFIGSRYTNFDFRFICNAWIIIH